MRLRLTGSFLTASAAAVFLAISAAAVPAAEYRIDTAHSFIQFRTKHLGISWLIGRFNRFEGSMTYDAEAGPESQSIEVTIDAASLDTNHAERDKHLRDRGFFNVGEYPTITFVSTGYDGDAEGGVLSGELTLLGVTRPIAIDVRMIAEGDDPWGGYRAGFEGSYILKRSEFGMDRNLGPSAEAVEVDLFIEAIRN